jgi:hypothetical protein
MTTKKKNSDPSCKNVCSKDEKNCNIQKSDSSTMKKRVRTKPAEISKTPVLESGSPLLIEEKSPHDAARKLMQPDLFEWRAKDTEVRNALQGLKIKELEMQALNFQSSILDRDYQDRRRELADKLTHLKKEHEHLKSIQKDAYTQYSKMMERLATSKGITDWKKMVIDSTTGIVREEITSPSGSVDVA